MRAAWWWIDRWRNSTAYKDMRLAEQGAYRNLLDELWTRDGLLPDDDRVLGNICGAAKEWARVRDAVMGHFRKVDGGWRNDTHDEVRAESERRKRKQADYRAKHRNDNGNAGGNGASNKVPIVPPSLVSDQKNRSR